LRFWLRCILTAQIGRPFLLMVTIAKDNAKIYALFK